MLVALATRGVISSVWIQVLQHCFFLLRPVGDLCIERPKQHGIADRWATGVPNPAIRQAWVGTRSVKFVCRCTVSKHQYMDKRFPEHAHMRCFLASWTPQAQAVLCRQCTSANKHRQISNTIDGRMQCKQTNGKSTSTIAKQTCV